MNYSITYAITTNKNIRCYGCSQNCEKFQKEEYVNIETFKQHMNILKNIFSENFELHFAGGEPLLHKELIKLCEIANQNFPNVMIYIHTNGILLNTIKDNDLINLTQKNNVKFIFYLYPIISYLKTYQKQTQRFTDLNIDMYWNHENCYFNKFSLNRYNDKSLNQNNNQLLIIHNKIYPMSLSDKNINYYLLNDIKYIEINKLKTFEQIKKLFENINYSQNNISSLSNLYVNYYSDYEKLMDYVYDLGNFLKISFFYNNIKDTTSLKEFKSLLTRFCNGFLDIYIPFSKDTLTNIEVLELKALLKSQQNIENFNLYFISIDDDLQTQQYWFDTFNSLTDIELNTYFFKSKSLYLGEKTFFNNSRIIHHYILDASNFKQLKDPCFLVNIVNNKRRNK